MRNLMTLLLIGVCCASAEAESVYLSSTRLSPQGTQIAVYGTGVVIQSDESGSLILTCRHNVDQSPGSVWIGHRGDWVRCEPAVWHESEDMAIVRTSVRLRVTEMAESVCDPGSEVVIDGAGPAANDSGEPSTFRATILDDQYLTGERGLHVIPGDSGAPVVDGGGRLVGLVERVEGYSRESMVRRSQYAGRKTKMIPVSRIRERLNSRTSWRSVQAQRGQCGPEGCPITIGPPIPVTPMWGPFPVGPTQFVRPAVPVPKPPTIYVPQQEQRPQTNVPQAVVPQIPPSPPQQQPPVLQPTPDPISMQPDMRPYVGQWLEANREGLKSPPPTDAQVVKAVQQILYSDIERFRGPPANASSGDMTAIKSKLATIEVLLKRKQPVQILNNDGTVFSEDVSRTILDPIVIRLEEPPK